MSNVFNGLKLLSIFVVFFTSACSLLPDRSTPKSTPASTNATLHQQKATPHKQEVMPPKKIKKQPLSYQQLPEGILVQTSPRFYIRPRHLEHLDFEEVADTQLYYTWDEGKSWKLSTSMLQPYPRNNEHYVFRFETDQQGLIGFRQVCPALKDPLPQSGTEPIEKVYIDTQAPQAQSCSAQHLASQRVQIEWAFEDALFPEDGQAVTLFINGQEVAQGLPPQGQQEFTLEGENTLLQIKILCSDLAGNTSPAIEIVLP